VRGISYARLGDLEAVKELDDLPDLYVQVYAEPPYNGGPKYARHAFLSRTKEQLARPGFTLITAREAGALIRFSFGFQMSPYGWWANAGEAPPEILRASKFAVIELLVDDYHRGRGIGGSLIERLLNNRDEEYATLAARPDAVAHAMYLRWGWKAVGHFHDKAAELRRIGSAASPPRLTAARLRSLSRAPHANAPPALAADGALYVTEAGVAMSVEAGGLVVGVVTIIVALLAVVYSRLQVHSAQDAAASAITQADAAKEQVALAEKQLELAEKIRREQTEPYVVVDVQPSPFAKGFLILVIENIGTTVARNVQFSFDPPLTTARKFSAGPIGDAKILKEGIPMLPPGRRMELLFDFAPDRHNTMMDMAYSVTVEADGPQGRVEPMRYEIDIGVLFGWHPLWAKTLHDGVEALEEVRDALREIQGELQTLRPPPDDQPAPE
jgi:GNAT superfamily N-acetyltransferase